MPLLKTDTDTQTTAMSGDLSHNLKWQLGQLVQLVTEFYSGQHRHTDTH